MESKATARALERQRELIDLQIEAELKKQIISQCQARYGASYPRGSHFDVAIEMDLKDTVTARPIVYTVPGSFHKREVLGISKTAHYSTVDVLEQLLDHFTCLPLR